MEKLIYEPREDSFLLEEQVKKLAKGKLFLDMGCGSGIQGKSALSAGAKKVIFADVNQEALSSLKKQGFNAIKSNLFSNVKGRFDIIAFNPPYLPKDKREDKESALITSGGKRGDELILKFLKNASKHINKGGIILLVISSLTPKDKIDLILKKERFKKEVLSSGSFFFETIEVCKIKRSN